MQVTKWLLLCVYSCCCFHTVFSWRSTNPGGGGALNSPLICENNVWVVGSDLGGFYVSRNFGASWSPRGGKQGLTSTHVASMACTSSAMLIGTDGGLFKSTIAGRNIQQVSLDQGGSYVSALVVAADDTTIYATVYDVFSGTSPRIYKSVDGGDTFIQLPAAGLPSSNFRVVGMRAHPVDPSAIWIISGEGRFGDTDPSLVGAYFSVDGGQSFFRFDPQRGEVFDLAYALDPNNLNLLYVTTLENGVGRFFVSPDTGYGEWEERAVNGDQTGVILVNPTNPRHVRLLDYNYRSGTANTLLWESMDGGNTWTRRVNTVIGGWSQSDEDWGLNSSFQGDLQTIAYNPRYPNDIIWVNSQFVYTSRNGGQEWHDAVSIDRGNGFFQSRDLDNVVPIVIEPSEADRQLVYTGYLDMGIWRTDDGGGSWKSLNPDAQWTHVWGGKGGNTMSIASDPVRTNVVWAQVAGDRVDPLHLLKSFDRGETWAELLTGLPAPANRQTVDSLELDPTSPTNSRRLWFIINGDVYISNNDGNSWSMSLACGNCVRVHYTTSGIFAFGPSGMWRSTANGAINTWSPVALPNGIMEGWTPDQHWLNNPYTYAGPIDMAYRGTNELWLAVQSTAPSGGLYYSSNSGSSWSRVYTNPFVRSVAVDTRSNEVLACSSSALLAGGYDPQSTGVLIHQDGTTASGWTEDNSDLVWKFCTYVRVRSRGYRWIISPGEGVMWERGPGGFNACFSGTTEVMVENKGVVSMKDLSIGDRVQVEGGKFEPVFSFGHRDENQLTMYLRMKLSTGRSLDITPDHMVYAIGKGFVAASDIKASDLLVNGDGGPVGIMSIDRITSRGAFAPFTPSGTVLVNQVLASTYIAIGEQEEEKSLWKRVSMHWIAHKFEFPHRLVCHYYLGSCPQEMVGMPQWLEACYHGSLAIVEMKDGVLARVVWLVIVGILLLFAAAETLVFQYPVATMTTVVVLLVSRWVLGKKVLISMQEKQDYIRS